MWDYVNLLFVICHVLSHAAEIPLPPMTPFPTDMKHTSLETIIEGLGMAYESYSVTTEDGYILNLNRMIDPRKVNERNKGIPVLFVHGMQMYSESWFLQNIPEHNLPVAYLLRGYDVWLGDQRGTIRSKRHVNLTSDSYEFWDFSFHETGIYDLPAFIDFILGKTKHEKLAFSGLSLGCTFFFVLCSEKPEYQDKLYGAIIIQPAAGGAPDVKEMSSGASLLMQLFNVQMNLHVKMRIGPSLLHARSKKLFGYFLCQAQSYAVMSSLTGFSTGVGCQFNKENLCARIAISLGGTSARTVVHTFQLFQNGGRFCQYDWGARENLRRYGTIKPPEYDVSKIRAFTALYVSDIDEYAPTRTVIPFTRKFGGPTYVCKYPDVCHLFTMYDSRVEPYVNDSADVLDSMTGQTNSNKMHSKTCHVAVESRTRNEQEMGFIEKTQGLISQLKMNLVDLLPGFIAKNLM